MAFSIILLYIFKGRFFSTLLTILSSNIFLARLNEELATLVVFAWSRSGGVIPCHHPRIIQDPVLTDRHNCPWIPQKNNNPQTSGLVLGLWRMKLPSELKGSTTDPWGTCKGCQCRINSTAPESAVFSHLHKLVAETSTAPGLLRGHMACHGNMIDPQLAKAG